MDGLVIGIRELLIAVVIIALSFLVVVIGQSLRRKSVLRGQDQDQDIRSLRRELEAIRMRLDAIEARMRSPSLATPFDSTAEDATEEAFVHSHYGQAMLLARDGLDVDELADRCGISISEANLISAIHGHRRES